LIRGPVLRVFLALDPARFYNLCVPLTVRSFAKINLGLCIGPLRADGFHELRTVYQTIALHDRIRVAVQRGSGIEIRCADERVPLDATNTCARVAERVMAALSASGRLVIEIEKRLPVQGGLGGASANAVAVMLALELVLKKRLAGAERLRIAAEVGSDLPLFLVGGTVLGVGRGEEVYPLPDVPPTPCVLVLPEIGVSTPRAFADWDQRLAAKLTAPGASDRMLKLGRELSAWLSDGSMNAGAPARGRSRVGNPLLDLVHTGIANDFEQVVFPQHPVLREVRISLEQSGARYASLSGSGSAIYGLFATAAAARKAVAALLRQGIPARATATLTRREYWRKFRV
jgi:4-diphosphocytidyl-2-C-methyl-D-erythritol kinase